MTDASEGLHPIGEVIATVLEDGPRGVPTLSKSGIAYVQKALDEYLDAGDALMAAVDCVLTAAHLLEVEKNAKKAAVALVELVDRKIVIDALIAINEAKEARQAEAVKKRAGEFQKFTGRPEPSPRPATPTEPEEAPEESGKLKLDNFNFPKRL